MAFIRNRRLLENLGLMRELSGINCASMLRTELIDLYITLHILF